MLRSSSQPNILLVMADQLSALATSPYGNPDVLTPHMAELSERGTVFQSSYCNSPLCAPSRASMMTGLLSSRLPVNDNAEELRASIPTFAHHLRRSGYLTILSGKMHFVGPDQLHGFEDRLTTDIYPADFAWTRYWPALGVPPRITNQPGNQDREMAQMVKESGPVAWSLQLSYDEEVHFRALEQLRSLARRKGQESGRPWFLCVSYTHPHDPYVATPEYWSRYEGNDIKMPEESESGAELHPSDVWVNTHHGVDRVEPTPEDVYRSRRGYYANASYIDDKLGELLRELERFGLNDNTVILFTSDHGDQLGEHGMWFKRTCREWSARVPLIVAGPGMVSGRAVAENVSLLDLYPTFLDLADVELPEHYAEFAPALEGRSIVPFLHGECPADWPNKVIIENNGEGTIKPIRALVKDRFKFIYVHEQPDQLFDLGKDPDEWHNLIGDPRHQELASQLRGELLSNWDPAETERNVLNSQLQRIFLREALQQGRKTSWDYQPIFDATRTWVRS